MFPASLTDNAVQKHSFAIYGPQKGRFESLFIVRFDTIRQPKLREAINGSVVDFWRNFRNLFLKMHHLSGSQKENGSVTVPELPFKQFGVSAQ